MSGNGVQQSSWLDYLPWIIVALLIIALIIWAIIYLVSGSNNNTAPPPAPADDGVGNNGQGTKQDSPILDEIGGSPIDTANDQDGKPTTEVDVIPSPPDVEARIVDTNTGKDDHKISTKVKQLGESEPHSVKSLTRLDDSDNTGSSRSSSDTEVSPQTSPRSSTSSTSTKSSPQTSPKPSPVSTVESIVRRPIIPSRRRTVVSSSNNSSSSSVASIPRKVTSTLDD